MFFYFIYRNKKLNLISNWKPCVNIRHNLMSKDSHPERFQAVIWSYMTYLLTAIGLTTGGSSTVHINTQTIQRTTHSTRAIHRTIQFTNQEECGPCPLFTRYTPAFVLQLRKNHGKTSVRVVGECQFELRKEYTEQNIQTIRIYKYNDKNKRNNIKDKILNTSKCYSFISSSVLQTSISHFSPYIYIYTHINIYIYIFQQIN